MQPHRWSNAALCHAAATLAAVKEMLSLLWAGRALLCEDHEPSTPASVPPTLASANAARKTVELALKRSVDMDLGVRLPGLMRALPLADVQVSISQAAYFRGEEKRFYEHALVEAAPLIVASGVTTQ